MSEHPTVFLSTGDYFLLLGYSLRDPDGLDRSAAMLRRKLDRAIVTFPDGIARGVIMSGRTIRYRIGGIRTEERTLIAGPNDPVTGLALWLLSPRGAALAGMSVGQSVAVPRADGTHETLVVDEVCSRAARRPMPASARNTTASDRIRQG